ncbi:hypothetical protein MNBD_GAMMA22-1869 [hydrothermal vent metagenome]|uniref:Outer-membrane lipoprotein carrier protein n=1 Tax=hydrothermal vent metagenome TaxID=652676 RepID=A0A3B1A6S9_9ZZZZ
MKNTIKQFYSLIIVATLFLFTSNTVFAASVISKYFSGINSFKVDFTQKSIELDNSVSKVSLGYLIVKNPDKFYLEYTKPDKLIYVADGKKLWSYDEDLEQVIVKTQSNILINTPAMILSQPQDIDIKYNIIELGTKNRVTKYKLTPKLKNTTFESITIGFSDGNLKSMEMLDNFGQHTLLRFNNIEKNPSLKPNTFNFVPPEGVDVISDDVS